VKKGLIVETVLGGFGEVTVVYSEMNNYR